MSMPSQGMTRRTMLASAAATGLSAFAVPRARAQTPPPVPSQVHDWIRRAAVPLRTAEPSPAIDDLAVLRQMIGAARIVSLGETTHGTREHFQLKHRIIQYCVAELGFTHISMETTHGAALAANDYVLGGRGSAADALSAAGTHFWLWNTEEVATLLDWMREWNRTHDRKVRFLGFDMQFTDEDSARLVAYLARVAPALADRHSPALEPLGNTFTFARIANLDDAAKQRILAAVDAITAALQENGAAWQQAAGTEQWRLAVASARVLKQKLAAPPPNLGGDYIAYRDRSMAENVIDQLDAAGTGARLVLWAHNGHVRRTPWFGLGPMMGNHLHQRLGADHVVVGFAFNEGGMTAIDAAVGRVREFTLPPALENTFDDALARHPAPIFALDLRRAPASGPVADWLAAGPGLFGMGYLYSDAFRHGAYDTEDPRTSYDILVFTRRTSGSRINPAVQWLTRPSTAPRPPDQLPTAAANLDFERRRSDGTPDAWLHHRLDMAHAHAVEIQSVITGNIGDDKAAVRMARAAPWHGGEEGQLLQIIAAAPFRGRRLRFSATVRADAEGFGTGAQIYMRTRRIQAASAVQGSRPMRELLMPIPQPTIDTLLGEQPATETDGLGHMLFSPVRSIAWTEASVEMLVPQSADQILLGIIVTGNAAGHFTDLKLEVV